MLVNCNYIRDDSTNMMPYLTARLYIIQPWSSMKASNPLGAHAAYSLNVCNKEFLPSLHSSASLFRTHLQSGTYPPLPNLLYDRVSRGVPRAYISNHGHQQFNHSIIWETISTLNIQLCAQSPPAYTEPSKVQPAMPKSGWGIAIGQRNHCNIEALRIQALCMYM